MTPLKKGRSLLNVWREWYNGAILQV